LLYLLANSTLSRMATHQRETIMYRSFASRPGVVAKYRPEFPTQGFADLNRARQWATTFVHWYNHEHALTSDSIAK
jgi:hypothetical protein